MVYKRKKKTKTGTQFVSFPTKIVKSHRKTVDKQKKKKTGQTSSRLKFVG